jgi:excisionase family DNA binding protein
MSKIVTDLDPTDVTVAYWTLGIAAKWLNVSKTRVKQLVGKGRLRLYRLDGRTVLLSRDEVEAFQKRPGGRPKLTNKMQEAIEQWKNYGVVFDWMTVVHPSKVRGECRRCGRLVGTIIPKQGDGSVRVAVGHKPPEPAIRMRKPGGAVVLPRCNGSGLPPKGWPTGKVDLNTGLQIECEDPRYAGVVPEVRWRPGVKA